VDLVPLLEDFIAEMLGTHSAYALTDIGALDSTEDAAAFLRLGVRICEGLLADGWTPSPEAARKLELDRQLLSEADDESSSGRAEPPQRAAHALKPRSPTDDKVADELTQMRHALSSRAVIEQAKGIAMERYGLSLDVAWSWLVRTSQNRNVKVRAIAEELVASVSSAAQSAGSGDDDKPSMSSAAP
jgi:hypothetical protein